MHQEKKDFELFDKITRLDGIQGATTQDRDGRTTNSFNLRRCLAWMIDYLSRLCLKTTPLSLSHKLSCIHELHARRSTIEIRDVSLKRLKQSDLEFVLVNTFVFPTFPNFPKFFPDL